MATSARLHAKELGVKISQHIIMGIVRETLLDSTEEESLNFCGFNDQGFCCSFQGVVAWGKKVYDRLLG